GIPEIVIDGVTGLLVPMGDSQAMAIAICRMLEDPELALRMGARGRLRVREQFTIQHTTAKVEAIYSDLLVAGRRVSSSDRSARRGAMKDNIFASARRSRGWAARYGLI